MPGVPDLIYELLPRLREDKGLSRPKLAEVTIRNAERYGTHVVPAKSIEALENPNRVGQIPKAHTLVALAKALGVEADVFYEWPIALAQANRPGGGSSAPGRRRPPKPSGGGRDQAKEREAQQLAEQARQRSGRPADGPKTRPDPRRRRGQGK